MTIYVDDMLRKARLGRYPAYWSHLFADSHDELMAFAQSLGLRDSWLQHAGTHREHFDVTASVRDRAIRHGATTIRYPRGTADLMLRKRDEATA